MINKEVWQQQWRYIDESSAGLYLPVSHSFATDDTLCQSVGSGNSSAVVRTWVHRDTVVLGVQDSRLPYLQQGIEWLADEGMDAFVRTSGGLAVILDEGIWNASLLFADGDGTLSIDEGYERMVTLIREMFPETSIHDGEISDSYCPGRYDLSINGQKFAGISQRRIRKGIAVQIYLCVEGSGSERAELVQQFYDRAGSAKAKRGVYPAVRPTSMASLQELVSASLTVHDVSYRLLTTLQAKGASLESGRLTREEQEEKISQLSRVEARNQKLIQKQ